MQSCGTGRDNGAKVSRICRQKQAHFCGVCGWCFCGSVNYSRRAAIRKALDHFMARLQLVKGGLDPLWALACLCLHKLAVLFD